MLKDPYVWGSLSLAGGLIGVVGLGLWYGYGPSKLRALTTLVQILGITVMLAVYVILERIKKR